MSFEECFGFVSNLDIQSLQLCIDKGINLNQIRQTRLLKDRSLLNRFCSRKWQPSEYDDALKVMRMLLANGVDAYVFIRSQSLWTPWMKFRSVFNYEPNDSEFHFVKNIWKIFHEEFVPEDHFDDPFLNDDYFDEGRDVKLEVQCDHYIEVEYIRKLLQNSDFWPEVLIEELVCFVDDVLLRPKATCEWIHLTKTLVRRGIEKWLVDKAKSSLEKFVEEIKAREKEGECKRKMKEIDLLKREVKRIKRHF